MALLASDFDLAALNAPAPSIPPPPPQEPPDPWQGPPSFKPARHAGIGAQAGAVKWELAALAAYFTTINLPKVIKDPQPFRFVDEGWFGRDSFTLGVDKMAHAFNTYLLAELIQARIRRKTGGAPTAPLAGALLASGLALYGEIYDGFEEGGGFSWNDVAFNTAGAAISVLRNAVPGLDRKLDFRIMIVPNSEVYTFQGKRHFAQQRFLLALKLAGFERFSEGPLRYVELHAGYYAANFTKADIARGLVPERRPFIGVGLNMGELLFGDSNRKLARTGREILNYVQIPYTAVHVH